MPAPMVTHLTIERDPLKPSTKNYQKTARILTVLILLLAAVCAAVIFFLYRGGSHTVSGLTAETYQDGQLIRSIPLDDVTEPCTFTVTGENGCTNEIEVRPGSIGILSASCPDKLCVRQGFISSTLLPITCLPNRLVIRLEENDVPNQGPDILTH